MSPDAIENHSDDDLYCDPSLEPVLASGSDGARAAAKHTTTTSNPFQKALPRIRPGKGSVVVDSRFTWVNIRATPQKAPCSHLPLRISDEWAAIDKIHSLYAFQLLDNERESMEAEINWREKEFERLEALSRKQVPVRFTLPMNGGHLGLLADHPDLLLRYFHNERRIAKAIERCEVEFRHMHLAQADPSRKFYYTEVQKLRRGILAIMRLELEPVAKTLITHITSLLYARVGVEVTKFKRDDVLCLLEGAFIDEVILRSVTLSSEWGECCTLEKTILQSQVAITMHAPQDLPQDRTKGKTLADLQVILSSRSMAP
ncbi:hypothetical protein PMIN03_012572 [Paraphaeosphaeria minitans]